MRRRKTSKWEIKRSTEFWATKLPDLEVEREQKIEKRRLKRTPGTFGPASTVRRIKPKALQHEKPRQ